MDSEVLGESYAMPMIPIEARSSILAGNRDDKRYVGRFCGLSCAKNRAASGGSQPCQILRKFTLQCSPSVPFSLNLLLQAFPNFIVRILNADLCISISFDSDLELKAFLD